LTHNIPVGIWQFSGEKRIGFPTIGWVRLTSVERAAA
jgi:hypothetical protein